jgi:hypothetical protein
MSNGISNIILIPLVSRDRYLESRRVFYYQLLVTLKPLKLWKE